jgi:hypothetical protein
LHFQRGQASQEEAMGITADTKNNKVAGLDGIFSEYTKTSQHLLPKAWTIPFKKCLEKGDIPET